MAAGDTTTDSQATADARLKSQPAAEPRHLPVAPDVTIRPDELSH
jgi:hypothetical protein